MPRIREGQQCNFRANFLAVGFHATSMGQFEVAVKGRAKKWAPGLVNFVPALAYHFCLNLPAAFTKPGASTLADLCMFLAFALSLHL